MKISIIIPVYGVEKYIGACLKSVADQKADCEVECLIVDDCGPDRSMELARGFIDAYRGPIDFKIIQREANGGLSAARNSGIDAATGSHIFFLDSDDELAPEAIQHLADAARRIDADIIMADYYTRGARMPYPHSILPQDAVFNQPMIFKKYVHATWYSMACMKLYRRDFINNAKMRFREGILHEDELWTFQCALRAGSLSTIYDVCYIYNIRHDSITTSPEKQLKRLRDSATILLAMFDEVRRHKPRYSKALHKFWAFRLWSFFTQAEKIMTEDELLDHYRRLRAAYPVSVAKTAIPCSLHLSRQLYNLHRLLPARAGLRLYLRSLRSKSY